MDAKGNEHDVTMDSLRDVTVTLLGDLVEGVLSKNCEGQPNLDKTEQVVGVDGANAFSDEIEVLEEERRKKKDPILIRKGVLMM